MTFALQSEYGETLVTISQCDGQVIISQDGTIALYPEQADAYLSALREALIEAVEVDQRA